MNFEQVSSSISVNYKIKEVRGRANLEGWVSSEEVEKELEVLK